MSFPMRRPSLLARLGAWLETGGLLLWILVSLVALVFLVATCI